MKAASASTNIADGYRAGVELGAALRDLAPEVVFLFSSIHYGGSTDLLDGLYDSVERAGLIVIGNSGDGFYETHGASDIGAAALGLNSGGTVRWHMATAGGLAADPIQTTRSALAAVRKNLGERDPALAFLVSDFRADASLIEQVLEHETRFPVVGGFASDDQRITTCAVYANRQVLSDSIAVLAADGDLRFDISIGNSLTPVGRPGTIEDAAGKEIRTIDGMDAMAFIERETGKPVLRSDRGVTCLTIVNADEPGVKRLRSIMSDFSQSEGELQLYGGIRPGMKVQVCLARPEDLIREVHEIAERARRRDFQPAAAVVVSCAGRKSLLGSQIGHEISALSQQFGPSIPIVGFPSLGEIGPLKAAQGYTPNLFHNMTYVLLLIGA